MIRENILSSFDELLSRLNELYDLNGCNPEPIAAHKGGRNLVLQTSDPRRIIRISHTEDRAAGDYLAETEYVDYLRKNGAPVAGVIRSRRGNLVETICLGPSILYVSMFEYAPGDLLVDHNYQYREGAPLKEYFFNCGSTLGKIHALSKKYQSLHRRCDFFDKYTPETIHNLIPASMPALKARLIRLLSQLRAIAASPDNYGMVHFDYSDGNYHINYKTGDITVFDFDNCCTCWYMFDIANLWTHGVGWIAWEPDASRRKAFMDDYFATIIEGYRSETDLSDKMLEKLPLFIQTVLMENILDEFEVQKFNGEFPEIDEEMNWRAWCLIEDIPFEGFFHERYDPSSPFELPLDD